MFHLHVSKTIFHDESGFLSCKFVSPTINYKLEPLSPLKSSVSKPNPGLDPEAARKSDF
jgi:hypothetical protein